VRPCPARARVGGFPRWPRSHPSPPSGSPSTPDRRGSARAQPRLRARWPRHPHDSPVSPAGARPPAGWRHCLRPPEGGHAPQATDQPRHRRIQRGAPTAASLALHRLCGLCIYMFYVGRQRAPGLAYSQGIRAEAGLVVPLDERGLLPCQATGILCIDPTLSQEDDRSPDASTTDA